MENGEYEEVITNDNIVTRKNEENTWKPMMRQAMVCAGIWYIYLMQGLYLGAPTVLIAQVRREANSTDAVTDEMSSWLSSVQVFSSIPIGLVYPWLINRIGRKYTYFIMCSLLLLSYILFYFSSNLYHVLISLAFSGASVAGSTTFMPILIAEYTAPKNRGIFLTFNSASACWGIWISNAIGTFFDWKNIAVVSFVCSVYLLTAFFWPESPTWLAMKGRYSECAKSHRWLKGTDKSSEKELAELINFNKMSRNLLVTKDINITEVSCFRTAWNTLTTYQFYKPGLICLLLFLQCLLTGKFVISIYAIEVLQNLTQNESVAYKAMLILDGVTVFSMYLGCILSRYMKRKIMLLIFSGFGILLLYLISIYVYFVNFGIVDENNILIILLLSGFSIVTGCGPMILPASIYGEIVPSRYQTLIMTINGFGASIIIAVFLKISPLMFKTLKMHGCFLFFAVSSTIALGILYTYLPETKDKTVLEIEESFNKNKKRPEQGINLMHKNVSK